MNNMNMNMNMDMESPEMKAEAEQVQRIIQIAAEAGVEITPDEALAYIRGEPNIDLEMLINNSNNRPNYKEQSMNTPMPGGMSLFNMMG